jgi:uncharacterized protein Yka (UPF0111/DUF47 family)
VNSPQEPASSAGRLRRRRLRWAVRGWAERLSLSAGTGAMTLLVAQGEVSVEALAAFEAWSRGGAADQARRVLDLEHAADDARHALVAVLKTSLATPIGQEDLFVLSERCDRVVNRVKNIVAEADALAWSPDAHALRMAHALHSGMSSVLDGFRALTASSDQAADAAVTAIHCVRGVEHAYRHAMADLAGHPDLREVFTAREMYRYYARASEGLEALADRLWYAVLAEP